MEPSLALYLESTKTEEQKRKELDSRRLRIVYIGMDDLLSVFVSQGHKTIRLIEFPNLPTGYTVLNVNYSFSRNAWAICVYHKEFSLVAHFEEIPILNDILPQRISTYVRTDNPVSI